MTESLMTKNLMNEDLLMKIQREMDERLRELRGAVDEHERLAAELRALDAAPEPLVASQVPASPDIDSELPVALGVAPEPSVAPEPCANVVRLPTVPRLSRTRMVSPKVARLMGAPRRPALERSGVARVGAHNGSCPEDDLFPGDDRVLGIDEVDTEAEVYERSL